MEFDDVLLNIANRIMLGRVMVPCKLTGGLRGVFTVTLFDSDSCVVGRGQHHRLDRALDYAVDEFTTAQDTRADMIADVQDARKDSGV